MCRGWRCDLRLSHASGDGEVYRSCWKRTVTGGGVAYFACLCSPVADNVWLLFQKVTFWSRKRFCSCKIPVGYKMCSMWGSFFVCFWKFKDDCERTRHCWAFRLILLNFKLRVFCSVISSHWLVTLHVITCHDRKFFMIHKWVLFRFDYTLAERVHEVLGFQIWWVFENLIFLRWYYNKTE